MYVLTPIAGAGQQRSQSSLSLNSLSFSEFREADGISGSINRTTRDMKDPICHMCRAGVVTASWSIAQKAAGSAHIFLSTYQNSRCHGWLEYVRECSHSYMRKLVQEQQSRKNLYGLLRQLSRNHSQKFNQLR